MRFVDFPKKNFEKLETTCFFKMERGFCFYKLLILVTVLVETKFVVDVNADFENSWTMYMEQPCCTGGSGNHHVRHHRGISNSKKKLP